LFLFGGFLVTIGDFDEFMRFFVYADSNLAGYAPYYFTVSTLTDHENNIKI